MVGVGLHRIYAGGLMTAGDAERESRPPKIACQAYKIIYKLDFKLNPLNCQMQLSPLLSLSHRHTPTFNFRLKFLAFTLKMADSVFDVGESKDLSEHTHTHPHTQAMTLTIITSKHQDFTAIFSLENLKALIS